MILIMTLGIHEFQDGMTLVLDGDVKSTRSIKIPDDFQTKIGVYCCGYSYNQNSEACDSTGYLDIVWQQRSIQNQDRSTKKKTSLGTKSCYFQFSSSGKQQLSNCPITNTFELQGNYDAEIYKYVQVDIVECSNTSSWLYWLRVGRLRVALGALASHWCPRFAPHWGLGFASSTAPDRHLPHSQGQGHAPCANASRRSWVVT